VTYAHTNKIFWNLIGFNNKVAPSNRGISVLKRRVVMSDRPVELDNFFDAEVSTKSDALANLDRAAIIGVGAITLITITVISLVFFSL